MEKIIYFDDIGNPHDGFILKNNGDHTAKILYNKKPLRRFWINPLEIEDEKERKNKMKNWIELDNVSPKEIDGKLVADKIIQIENVDGKEVEKFRGIKNCYKIISDE